MDADAALPAPGARLHEHGCTFTVWAPTAAEVALHFTGTHDRLVPLRRLPHGFHTADVAGARAGDRYTFLLDGRRELPDPASHFQPDGVHAASELVSPAFDWTDNAWHAPDIEDLILYELHVGTFTAGGTLDAAAHHLPALRELGITAVELMPVAEFPGSRNWGYDGVYPYAVHHDYGGPAGLMRFVDAAHAAGVAVHLDVVYNHLGPEGNYLREFGPYFTDRYVTPWGDALNFDGAWSDAVRDFFIHSAIRWVREFHIDGLRLDAVHAIIDRSARPFLEEFAARVHAAARTLGRSVLVVAESDLDDPRIIRPARLGGLGMDAQWLDDLHHALHSVITGESRGYYADYGTVEHLATAYRSGYVYTGQYSRFRHRRHGAPARGARPCQFVVFAQNHDQVGNRMTGDRLTTSLDYGQLRLVASAILLSPFVPLLFMGEEYGETAPFPYFVSHTDPDLVEAVRRGRRAEFMSFEWRGEPPDPQAKATFDSARLDRSRAERPGHRELLAFYRRLLALRRELQLGGGRFPDVEYDPEQRWIRLLRMASAQDRTEVHTNPGPATAAGQSADSRGDTSTPPATLAILNFGVERACVPLPPGAWRCRLDSAGPEWNGTGCTRLDAVEHSVDVEPFSAMLLSHDD